jgi:hypothetical protein
MIKRRKRRKNKVLTNSEQPVTSNIF